MKKEDKKISNLEQNRKERDKQPEMEPAPGFGDKKLEGPNRPSE
ncbi:hypothetical protein [Aneurinibacillus tyrosinisolvens]|nr:hypothetical protein [Aneurinibacillus tyrosinisolvens]